jgi:hypothetical protein
MKMKKYIKLIIIIFAVMIFELQIQPDDKELFMGLNVDSSLVRPNMMILVDNSASMNDVLYFPKKGFDGVTGTEDDGYDPNTQYTGVFDSGIDATLGVGEFGNDYEGHYTLNETRWVARWIIDGSARKFAPNDTELGNNWTGCYATDNTGYRFRVGDNGTSYFKEGDLVMYQNRMEPYGAALATIVKHENLIDGTWITLAYDPAADPENLDPTISIVGGPIDANSDMSTSSYMGHFQRLPDNATWQAVIIKLYGVRDIWGGEGGEGKCQYHDAGYPENYLKWVFLHAADDQRKAINHFSTYATFDPLTTIPSGYDVDEDGDGIVMSEGDIVSNFSSWCYKETGQAKYMTYLWTRIQVTREVLCWLARQHSQRIMLGLADFQEPPKIDYCGSSGGEAGFDPAGAESPVLDGLGDMSETNSLTDFLNNTYGIKANSETPLAEALADVWYYYKPGPQNKTYWPVSYELEKNITSTTNAVSDIKYWCQNNYVVLMTDGVSTKDDFKGDTEDAALYQYANSIFTSALYPVKHDEESWLYNNPKEYERWRFGWGDPDINDDPATVDTTLYCPNETCWDTTRLGTDYLDDVAYFLRHQDMYPDDDNNKKYFRTTIDPDKPNDPIWPDDQSLFTYVIGFNADNDMLRETAQNGDGGYFTADTFKELKEAFANVIVSINLRNFAFSSITAPKKTATAQNEEQTVSYVGYFLPSRDSLWEGHLLSFKLEDKWGWDSNNDTIVEYIHDSQEECLNDSGGIPCQRSVVLSTDQQWDAALRMPTIRNLYTHDGSTLIDFNINQNNKIKTLFESNLSQNEVDQIIADIRDSRLGDIFHSDVGFVGPPPFGKQFLSNINPLGVDDELYVDFYNANKDRSRVLYVGTNDGIMHMIYADDEQNRDNPAGEEAWGFIPDEVINSLEKIVLDVEHTYTVDGRLSANDVYYVKSGQSNNTWSTILVFGLRRGGRAYYALDITNINTQPTLLWKFKDADHSGQSWGKPTIGRIKIQDPNNASQIIDQWVAVLAGGFEFNSDNPTDTKGKALFVVNAATGELIWKVAYTTPTGTPDDPDASSGLLPDNSTDSNKLLTTVNVFNYPIPSAVLAVDKDSNGFLDTIYFGNLGGHLFKANISDTNPDNWTTQLIFEDQSIPKIGPVSITDMVEEISGTKFKITLNGSQSPFQEGDTIMGTTSYASGYITYQDKNVITVQMNSGTFIVTDAFKEEVVSYTYDPIYMTPAAAFDTCYQLWLAFGTGDRDRPRSYPHGGKFVTFRDNGTVNYIYDPDPTTISSNMARFQINNDILELKTNPSDANGFFFYFPDTGERLFEPEPIILPDENIIPHIYFNTYQPPPAVPINKDDPCDLPAEGIMKLYDISLNNCGTLNTIGVERETGRIAGGGIYAGKEYVMYKSKSGDVADVPGGEGGQFITDVKRLPYPGGLLFWKEKKR